MILNCKPGLNTQDSDCFPLVKIYVPYPKGNSEDRKSHQKKMKANV